MNTRYKAFTLLELAIVFVIGVLLVGILIPAMSHTHCRSPQMSNTSQIRGLQQSFVSYAQGNRDLYPGLTYSPNNPDQVTSVPNSTQKTLDSGQGYTVAGRYAILLKESYFSGEYCLSPIDYTKTPWLRNPDENAAHPVVTSDNFSYAMLDIHPGQNHPQNNVEWQDTTNSEAIVNGDRALGQNESQITSIWTKKPGDWKGSVAWNDNHTSFLDDYKNLKTRYGQYRLADSQNKGYDNLFAIDADKQQPEAYLVYYGDSHNNPDIENTPFE